VRIQLVVVFFLIVVFCLPVYSQVLTFGSNNDSNSFHDHHIIYLSPGILPIPGDNFPSYHILPPYIEPSPNSNTGNEFIIMNTEPNYKGLMFIDNTPFCNGCSSNTYSTKFYENYFNSESNYGYEEEDYRNNLGYQGTGVYTFEEVQSRVKPYKLKKPQQKESIIKENGKTYKVIQNTFTDQNGRKQTFSHRKLIEESK